jgi:hypothetical protein
MQGRSFGGTALVAAATFGAFVAIFRGVVSGYFPRGDEFALIVESTPFVSPMHWLTWFTSGYSKYFRPIPFWTDPFTNFIRPTANLCYYVNFALWGERWGAYLYLNYAVLAVGAAAAFWLSRRFLGSPWALALASSCLVAFNPAIRAATVWPSFILDPLAAVLALAAFAAVVRRRFWLSLALLVVAVFTKETVAFAPLAASITWVLVTARARRGLGPSDLMHAAALIVIPLGLWTGARYLAFHSLGGVYALRGIYRHLDALLRWPLGLDGALAPELVTGPLKSGRWREVSALAAGGALLTLSLWGAGAVLVLRAKRLWAASGTAWKLVLLLPWVAGCLAVVTALNLEPRFGYFLYLCGIPMMAYGTHYLWSRGGLARTACLLPTLVATALLAPEVANVLEVRSVPWTERFLEEGALSRSLIRFLHRESVGYERLFVLNDFVGAYAGGYLGAFSRSSCPVTVLNGLDPAPSRASDIRVTFSSPDEKRVRISVALSKDVRIEYWGAFRLRDALRLGATATEPGADVSYWLPTDARSEDRDHRLCIGLSRAGHYGIVYFDTKVRRWTLYDPTEGSFISSRTLGGVQRPGATLCAVPKNGGVDGTRTRDLLRDRQAF